MDKLITIWSFICRRKYLITVVAFAVINELNSNPDAIEQVAREKYLMKKPNEDIYVFEDNK